MEDLIDSNNISAKDFVTHEHDLAIHMKEGLPFVRGSLRILIYVFDWLYVIR